ncbi:MAG TPA: hypothetical protein VG028_04105 [Terriglobia bacterium]|nr:hypothetical protein [Terriglobia bacterium]
MGSQSAAELLIRIGADPSKAESSIRQFRANFSQSLAGVSSDLALWSAQGTANFSAVDQTAQTLSQHFNVNVEAVNNFLDRNRQMAQIWKTQMVASLTEVLNASQNLSLEFGKTFLQFDSALGANVASAIIWQTSIGAAFSKAAVQAVTAIAQQSLVQAIQAAALGFYLLAVQDYSGAAAAFESAAIYGAVGGAAALAGRAIATPAGTRGGSSAGGGAPGGLSAAKGSPTGQSSATAPAAQNPVQVIFQGPVYGGQAGIDELVRHITQAVTERDVNLVAYTVVRQPTVRE